MRAARSWSGEAVDALGAWAWSTRLDDARTRSAAEARGLERTLVREGVAGQNGIRAWHALPGFGGWAAGPLATDPVPDPWDPSWQRPYTLLLAHPALQPARLAVTVPQRDLVAWRWGTADDRPFVRMYPAPTHPIPDGHVGVRATLWDPERAAPAAWALLEVSANGHLSVGVAGEDGQVVVFLPQPRLRSGVAPAAQRWPLTVRARYGRLADPRVESPPLLSSPPWATTPAGRLRADLPTLDRVEAQPLARLFATWASAAVHAAYTPPDLAPGGELLLASAPQPPAVPLARRETRLFVTP